MTCRPPRLLTPDQERIIRDAITDGATRDEAAALAGITRQWLDTRMRDQLADLRVGRGRREQKQKRGIDPTPAEIAMRAAAVRSTWPPERWGIKPSHTADDPRGHGVSGFPLRRR